MTYVLDDDDGATTLTILQEDARPGAQGTDGGEDESPVLSALKTLAEPLVT